MKTGIKAVMLALAIGATAPAPAQLLGGSGGGLGNTLGGVTGGLPADCSARRPAPTDR